MSVLDGPREEWRKILHEGTPKWVRVEGSELLLPEGTRIDDSEANYMAPCEPSKIICVHLNYESRRLEFHAPEQPSPSYFHKPITGLNSHRGMLNRPANCQYLNYEGEVAAIVGKPMRNIARKDVWDYLAGFAPANDVGVQDFRDTDLGSMLRVKGQDGHCPIGPGIVSGIDIRESSIRTYINGEVVQSGVVGEMLFGIDYLFADLTRHITLLPGDVVLTGTPANSRPMALGDVVSVEVSNVGTLVNTVQEAPAPAETAGHQPTDSDAVRSVALGQFGPRSGASSQ